MGYEVVRSVESRRDLVAIFRHLVDSYTALGDPLAEALQRAARRIASMETEMIALGRIPHLGTQLPGIGPGLRHVTKNRAVFYFEVDDAAKTVRILAVFFDGQDHQRLMLRRLGSD